MALDWIIRVRPAAQLFSISRDFFKKATGCWEAVAAAPRGA